MIMKRFETISNTELSQLIDDWTKGERNRRLLKRRLIDCITLERLSEEFNLTVDRVKQIIYKEQKNLEAHIPFISDWVEIPTY